jgi:DNA-binding protein HU-beta
MNKGELVATLAKGQKETKAAAERWLNATLNIVRTGVKKDGSVQLIGFGSFTVRKRAARAGRNPQTGAKIQIKASKTVGFKASKDWRKTL